MKKVLLAVLSQRLLYLAFSLRVVYYINMI